jgi:hypothetical protein
MDLHDLPTQDRPQHNFLLLPGLHERVDDQQQSACKLRVRLQQRHLQQKLQILHTRMSGTKHSRSFSSGNRHKHETRSLGLERQVEEKGEKPVRAANQNDTSGDRVRIQSSSEAVLTTGLTRIRRAHVSSNSLGVSFGNCRNKVSSRLLQGRFAFLSNSLFQVGTLLALVLGEHQELHRRKDRRSRVGLPRSQDEERDPAQDRVD